MHGFSRAYFYTAVIFVAILTLFPARTHAIEYGGLGGRPAYPRLDNKRTESIFIHTIEPEETIEEGVEIINSSSETMDIMLYAVDSIKSSGGGFACKQYDDEQTGVGTWIKLEKDELTLAANQRKVVPFTITAPQNPDIGEHNGCIVIQEKRTEETTRERKPGINIIYRTGIRIAVTIPGELKKKLEIVNYEVEKKDNGDFILRPKVKNTGNVSVDAEIDVRTSYFFDKELDQHNGKYTILRDDTAEWNFEVKRPFWGGWFKTYFTAKYSKNPDMEIGKEDKDSMEKLTSKTITFFSPPTLPALLIMISVLFALAGTIFSIWLFFKRKRWIENEWEDYKIKKSDTIKSIAKKLGVSPRLIARANKLKSPYTVGGRKIIKIPPSK